MSYTLKLSQDHDDRRLDRTLLSIFKWITRGEIMRAIRTGDVRINSKRVREPGTHVYSGDELTVIWPLREENEREKIVRHSASWGKIKIIFQGENILILNKPSGMLVQPNEANGDSVISRVWAMLNTKTPAAVHRLDRNTTGVLAIALHGDALRAMEELFKLRRVRKFYRAVVVGKAPEEIMIEAPLLKDAENNLVRVPEYEDEGLPALTKCTRLATNGKFSLVELELLTGRTHQARVHMAYIKHPIIGDRKYGDFKANKLMKNITRPFLHAYRLEFPENLHESLAEIEGKNFTAEIPEDMKNFLEAERINL